jgi:hypothetical protein
VVGKALRGSTLGVVEVGTGGQVMALLDGESYLRAGELVAVEESVEHLAEAVRHWAKSDIGLAVRAGDRDGDTAVTVAIDSARGTHSEERIVFLAGSEGRRRAAIAAADVLRQWLATNPVGSAPVP